MAVTDIDWLEEIRACNDITVAGERQKLRAIKNARRAGISWERIGKVLGVTRQATMQRYAKYCDEE